MTFHHRTQSVCWLRVYLTVSIFAVAIAGHFAPCSTAGLFTLVDENSTAQFDTANPGNAFTWTVDGVDQLFQQDFWFRVGNVAEQSVHDLPISVEGSSDANFNGDQETLFVRYLGAGFRVDVTYSLDGGLPGSRTADMAEQISISNTGNSALDFHFFQYVDFDLNGTTGNDTAVFTNSNAVQQSEGVLAVNETVITPVPSHREINFFPLILAKLTDALPTTLSDLPAAGVPLGPSDVTWAFQWDFTLPRGGTFSISKDKLLTGIPEPATLALFAMGFGMAIAGWRRR